MAPRYHTTSSAPPGVLQGGATPALAKLMKFIRAKLELKAEAAPKARKFISPELWTPAYGVRTSAGGVQIRKDESGTMAGRHNAGEYISQLTTP